MRSIKTLRSGLDLKWTVVFHAPEDHRWVVVCDGAVEAKYGIAHNCAEIHPTYRTKDEGDRCAFCGDYPPEALDGYLKLINWDK